MIETHSVAGLVEGFDPRGDGEAAKSRELVLGMLAATAAPFWRRQFTPGHITCSGLVLSPDGGRILLVLHRRLRRWLLPGGHVEAEDACIGDAGRREAIEETGAILTPDPAPLLAGVDVHGIPPRRDEPYHLHHDLMFFYRAASEALRPSEEVREVAWCAMAEFDGYQLPGNIRRGLARAVGG